MPLHPINSPLGLSLLSVSNALLPQPLPSFCSDCRESAFLCLPSSPHLGFTLSLYPSSRYPVLSLMAFLPFVLILIRSSSHPSFLLSPFEFYGLGSNLAFQPFFFRVLFSTFSLVLSRSRLVLLVSTACPPLCPSSSLLAVQLVAVRLVLLGTSSPFLPFPRFSDWQGFSLSTHESSPIMPPPGFGLHSFPRCRLCLRFTGFRADYGRGWGHVGTKKPFPS